MIQIPLTRLRVSGCGAGGFTGIGPVLGAYRSGLAVFAAAVLSLGPLFGDEGRAWEGSVLEARLVTENQRDVREWVIAGAGAEETVKVTVGVGDFAIFPAGAELRGRLIPGNPQRLEALWPNDTRTNAVIGAAARALRSDTVRRGRAAYRNLGERLPDFAFYNQDGRVVQSRELRGHDLVINFIFTRCMQPEMCPLSTQKMRRLQQLAQAAELTHFRQLTVSFDPAFDTPGRLHSYAEAYGIDTSTYDFATASDGVIRDLMVQLGVLRLDDEKLIYRHTLATLIVDPEGVLYYRVPSPSWDPEDFLAQILERRRAERSMPER